MLPRLLGWGVVPAMLITGFLHGVWHLPLLLTTGYYHPSGNPWIVAPLFLVTLTLAGVFFGFLRVWTGSVWPVAVAHAAANTAWGVTSEVSRTKSPLVLEYVGGESGAVVIGGLLIFDLVLIGMLRRARPAATWLSNGGPVAFVRRHQLAVFVVLAYALSWWAWIWYRLDSENVGAPILPMGPLLAALIVLFLVGGWPEVKDLLRSIVRWRVGWVWYLVALGLPGRAHPRRRRPEPPPRGAARSPSFRAAGAGRSRRALRLHLRLDRPRRGAGLARLRAAAPPRRPQRARRGADPRDDPPRLAPAALRRRVRRRERPALGRSPSSASRS